MFSVKSLIALLSYLDASAHNESATDFVCDRGQNNFCFPNVHLLSQLHLLKSPSFSPLICNVTFVMNQVTISIDRYLSFGLLVSPVPKPYFNYCSFVFEYYNFYRSWFLVVLSLPTFFFKIAFVILRPSHFCVNFRIALSISIPRTWDCALERFIFIHKSSLWNSVGGRAAACRAEAGGGDPPPAPPLTGTRDSRGRAQSPSVAHC